MSRRLLPPYHYIFRCFFTWCFLYQAFEWCRHLCLTVVGAIGGAVVTTGAGAGAGAGGGGEEQAANARAEMSPAALSDQRVETKRM